MIFTAVGPLVAVGAEHSRGRTGGPEGTPIAIHGEDSTTKKAGRQLEGVGHYRNGAGSARQE